jgi:hypothetical protein
LSRIPRQFLTQAAGGDGRHIGFAPADAVIVVIKSTEVMLAEP